MDTKNISVESLKEIVGEENIREAKAEDAVEGVEPSFVVEPGSIEEISEVMKLAYSEGLAVAPRGSGTKTYIGNPPKELDLVISTVRMDGVIEYVPGDQVVRVQAGIKLADLQEKLGESNQMLAIDPPETDATVGGLIATNASGPRRYSYGTVRDLIIGIRVVLADGTIAKAGSKVVKNVAGYDLSKLFTGSLGTLGVIAEANFRLHPVRDVSKTIVAEIEGGPQEVYAAVDAVARTQAEPTAIELRYSEDEKLVSLLLESIEGGIEAKVEKISHVLGSHGDVRDSREGDHLGAVLPAVVEEEDALVKLSAPPAELAAVLDSVLGAADRRGLNHPKITGHAGTGVTFVGLSGGDTGSKAEVIDELREIWVRRGGSVVLLTAPRELKEKVGVWGPPRDDIGLIGRVKDKFDSRGIMNPGRFVGGI
ncbi:MAG: FAD-binding oxidoreductase [Rubrobacteraceae bacterium]